MSKYIDAEKLIKSVNRYRDNAKAAFNPIEDDADYYKGKIDACEDIQEFIDSLQQEQPEVDLEKEAEAYWKAQGSGSHAQWDKYIAVVKHFTEWQKSKSEVVGKTIPAEVGYFNQRGLSILTEKSLERYGLEEGDRIELNIIKNGNNE